jgi:YfiH family protein
VIEVELPGARALFSDRHGGVSQGAFASLNLGRLTADEPAAVDENRRRLGERVGLGWDRFCYGKQVHGASVRRATEPPGPGRPYAEEDGQATALHGAAAIVFAADCLPVLMAADGAVAALHCGWRGLAAGIVEEGVRALRDVGGHGPIHAVIGPGAGACCYQVSEDVLAHFPPAARHGERNLDLKRVAAEQLHAAGVDGIRDVGVCTICTTDHFSHRRDGGVTGRQAGVVWRT